MTSGERVEHAPVSLDMHFPLKYRDILVPPLFIEGNSHSYNWSIFVFARATVPY